MTELRVTGFDKSVTQREVAAAIAGVGEYPEGEVKVGQIRFAPSGLGTVWVQCPPMAAKRAADAGKVRVGWVLARAEVLAPRLLQLSLSRDWIY